MALTKRRMPKSHLCRPMEVWLRTNPRPFLAALIAPGALFVLGIASMGWTFSSGAWVWGWAAGPVLLLAGLFLGGLLLRRAKLPVLARQRDQLLLYLDGTPPIAIPLQVVECFFAGQGDSFIKDRSGKELETAAIILRIAESATEWKHRDVSPRLAHWCEGYITIRGAWCEPIGPELLRSLNQRLVASQRALKAGQA
jgi:hypothetical protein